jgi:hypothetical protein
MSCGPIELLNEQSEVFGLTHDDCTRLTRRLEFVALLAKGNVLLAGLLGLLLAGC